MTALVSRRIIFLGAAAAAMVPMQQALAQVGGEGGDWFSMVKAHHALIAKSFEDVLAPNASPRGRKAALNKLAYQLTAHSVAEENVLYPALALHGMVSESDMLYLDQAHAKVMNTEIDMMAAQDPSGAAWLDKARELQNAVLKHAKEDEEGNLFAKLLKQLNSPQNDMLTMQYAKQFTSVKPTPVVV